MPYPLANLSKRTIRGDVAAVLGDNWPLTTSGAGNAGGTTAVFSSLIGVPVASVQNNYLVQEGGANDGEYRAATTFATTTGTITLRRSIGAQVANAVACHLHRLSPHLYTFGINEAIRDCYRALYRPILHHTFVRSPGLQRTVPLPRNMERVMRVMEDKRASDRLRDYFDRSNSTTDPGSLWTASSGTWGVSSETLYAPGDTDGDLLLAASNPYVKNGVIQAVVRGDTTAANFRVLALVFRYDDSSNYLLVRLVNGQVDLRKVDGGTDSSLVTGTLTTTENVFYTVRVQFDGTWIRVFVDDVEYITYELTGLNLKYLGYDESGTGTFGNIGVRLDKTGAPDLAVTRTVMADYFCHELVGRVERTDWERSYDGRSIELNTRGRGWAPSDSRMLWLEGMSELTQVAADSFETLTTDSTATVELQTADPAYEVLVQWAAYVVLREAAALAQTSNPDQRAEYAARAQEQLQKAERTRARHGMRYQQRAWV